jgi:ADP-heptose:LPS heptosyltransferase
MWWKIEPLVRRLNGLLIRLGPQAYIAIRWPRPMRKPFERPRLILKAPGGGIGDELMCLPVIEEIKRRNPACHITFVTRHAAFFKPHPSIDETLPAEPRSPGLRLVYHHLLPPPRPLMTMMAECVGIIGRFEKINPPPLDPPAAMKPRLDAMPRPLVAIQPMSSRWTTNKNWPAEHWRELIERLLERYSVIEVGTESLFPTHDFGPRFQSLAGATTLEEFAWVIKEADLFIGPSSAGMHLANAYGVRSVIVFGGYESPGGYDYPDSTAFYSPIFCAPCWRVTCPFHLECLWAIKPDAVFQAATGLLEQAKTDG